MPRLALRPAVLLIASTIALVIGAAIIADPAGFHAFGGVHVGADPGLQNELRAAGGGILSVGLLALAGVFAAGLRTMALTASAAVYCGYGLARFYSFAASGIPDAALVWIAVLELVIGAACFAAAARPPSQEAND